MKGKTGYLRGFASFLRGFASYGLTIIGYLCNRTRTMLGRMKTAPCCKEALEGRKKQCVPAMRLCKTERSNALQKRKPWKSGKGTA